MYMILLSYQTYYFLKKSKLRRVIGNAAELICIMANSATVAPVVLSTPWVPAIVNRT